MPLESDARVKIDEMLVAAGWIIQDRGRADATAGQGVAIREFALSTGKADYLLVVDGEAVGVVEAKRQGSTLTSVKEQSALYQRGQPSRAGQIRFLRSPLPFSYEATDVEILFSSELEPDTNSRPVFHFHRPQTLARWLGQSPVGTPSEQNDVLRSRLRRMPPLPRVDLRKCQYEAITALEKSLAQNRERALIQMATGSGKTYMAVSNIYRLIRYGKAKRVLFLVDRTNLARQTLDQFRQFTTPDTGRKFTELYNVQHLADNHFDSTSEVCITTIQRLYSILTGQPLEEVSEEESLFEKENDGDTEQAETPTGVGQSTGSSSGSGSADKPEKRQRKVSYNPNVPIEYFDVIFIDECHRSIYSEWRPVLEYFDSFLVGLSATPENRAFAFFNRNLVYEYSQAQSVADNVNVDYEIYRLRTKITEQGSKVERGNMLYYRNKQTREKTYEALEDDLVYEGRHLDRDVVALDQIRTVLRAYKDALFTELFPGRKYVPKTLIFAKDDRHADDIVLMVREVFSKGNDFAKKITYRTTGAKPEELINQFRNSYNPRIAVSVDMISTGTDIRPLEVLLFMRSIKSRTFFEQMKGRGCRTIEDEAFRLITPDGSSKVRYILFDAVGVTEGLKSDSPPLERKPSASLEELMLQVARGNYEDATLLSLAGRLGRLVKYVTPDDFDALQRLSGGKLEELAEGLITSLDFDQQLARAQANSGAEDPPASAIEEATLQLAQEATQPFKSQELRDLLLQLQRRAKQAIDDISLDVVLDNGFDEEQARREVATFRATMEQNKAKIDIFELAFQQAPGSLGERVQSVARAIQIPELGLNSARIGQVWRAYQKLDAARVRGAGTRRLLTDIIALIRYTMQRETDERAILEPYRDTVNRRFATWYAEQERQRQQPFNETQNWWLERIRDRIATDLQFEERDLDTGNAHDRGGRIGAAKAFGGEQELLTILREMNERLVA